MLRDIDYTIDGSLRMKGENRNPKNERQGFWDTLAVGFVFGSCQPSSAQEHVPVVEPQAPLRCGFYAWAFGCSTRLLSGILLLLLGFLGAYYMTIKPTRRL